jgi:LTXXQ motif family protein
MRKALIPMLASLALCGAGTAALITTNARAQANPRKPMLELVAASDDLMAQNLPIAPGMPGDMAAGMKQMCDDRYAGEVGRMAYLDARLQLSDTERPLFDHWKDVRLASAKQRAVDCNTRIASPDQDHANPVDRMGREEDMLKQRIADLDAERPAFAALYAALTPEQRELLSPSRPMDRGRGPSHPHPNDMGGLTPPPPPSL